MNTKDEIKELKKQIDDLEKRVIGLEHWIATHHCESYPPNIERIIGIPMPDKNTPIIPSVHIPFD